MVSSNLVDDTLDITLVGDADSTAHATLVDELPAPSHDWDQAAEAFFSANSRARVAEAELVTNLLGVVRTRCGERFPSDLCLVWWLWLSPPMFFALSARWARRRAGFVTSLNGMELACLLFF